MKTTKAQTDFARGYFCAVAALLQMDGDSTTARELFSAGGDCSRADLFDRDIFEQYGLLAAASAAKPD